MPCICGYILYILLHHHRFKGLKAHGLFKIILLPVHPYIFLSILMEDDSEIPATGISRINFDNGYFNNALLVPHLPVNLLSVIKMNQTFFSKWVTFTQHDVENYEVSTRKVVAVGSEDYDSRMYKFSLFLTYSS